MAPVPPAPTPPVSLVPTAPALGPTLVDDARELRPLRASASYTYRGKDFTRAQSQTVNFTPYSNVVSQSTDPSGVRESSANQFNDGADVVVVRNDPDRVVNLADVVITPAVTVAGFAGTELRSPVRQNDQIVLIERFDISLGEDVDGDGITDKTDFALYSRVIGREDATLATDMVMPTVRVDLTAKFRIIPSSGVPSVVVEQVQSQWYAVGVGVVKRTISVIGSGRAIDQEETLLAWDGVTDGLGINPSIDLRAPSTNEAVVSHAGAAGLIDSLLIFSKRSVTSNLIGFRVTKTDLRGRALATIEYPNLPGTASSMSVVSDASRAYVVTSNTRVPGLALIRFDKDGNAIDGPSGAVDLPVGDPNNYPRLADDRTGLALAGPELWVLWSQTALIDPQNSTYEDQVVIRAFDLNGRPTSAPHILVSAPVGTLPAPQMLFARGSEGVATYARRSSITNMNAQHAVKLTRTSIGFSAVDSELTGQLATSAVPLATSSHFGLLWPGRQDDGSSSIGQLALHAVAFDASGAFLRAGSGPNFDSESLGQSVFDNNTLAGSAPNGSVWLTIRKDATMWPEEGNVQLISHFALQRFSAAPWANNSQRSVVLRVPDAQPYGFRSVLALNDRLLILSSTNDDQPTRIRTVWLRGI